MSKRFIFPQQSGNRKKAKLDITITDHNFPPSQNAAVNTETDENNTWGDEIDDEMLLLASQACEKAISGHNISELPNYSICMDPPSTSTQIQTKRSSSPGCLQYKIQSSKLESEKLNDNWERNPALRGMSNKCNYNEMISENLMSNNSFTSKLPNYSMCMDPPSTSSQKLPEPKKSHGCFQFKVPSSNNIVNSISTKLNDKCEKISSPLRSMSKVCKADNVNISDDLIFNNMINQGQDTDQIYRQLLQLKEENEKLKSENGKLLEKCVTKEGETSILRTQLKTCQMAVDNARMDKIKAQETVQMDWSEKLNVANKQLSELKTQLDSKNLEIISVKEKCKVLESNKMRLIQVKSGNVSMSQSGINKTGMNNTQLRRVSKTSSAAQTEDKSHYLKLTLGYNEDHTKLTEMLPIIMDQTCEHYSILEYNEKLKQTHSYKKCPIYTTFHRLPSTVVIRRSGKKIHLGNLYEDLSYISTAKDSDIKKCLHIIRSARDVLRDVYYDLESIQQRLTTAFIKEMDDVYMDMTGHIIEVSPQHLLSGKAIYKEEQGIQARRMTTVIVYILEDAKYKDVKDSVLDDNKTVEEIFIDLINNICTLLDHTSTATLYSGLLLSMTRLLKTLMTKTNVKIIGIIKNIILSRPMGFVICDILQQMGTYSKQHIRDMCKTGSAGDLKVDHEQGVLLYRKDSCILRVVLEQIEAAMICIEKQNSVQRAVECGRSIIELYSKLDYAEERRDKSRCECSSVLMRVMVNVLKICSQMWMDEKKSTDANISLRAVCQYGLQVLYLSVMMDADRMAQYEGPLVQVCHNIKDDCEEMYSNMISEITSTFHSATEETPQSYNQQAWINSFQTFSITE